MKILYPVIEGDLLSQSDIKKYYSPTIDSEIRADYITYSAQKFALEVFKKESKKITNLVGSKFLTKKDLNTSFILYSLIISELFDDINFIHSVIHMNKVNPNWLKCNYLNISFLVKNIKKLLSQYTEKEKLELFSNYWDIETLNKISKKYSIVKKEIRGHNSFQDILSELEEIIQINNLNLDIKLNKLNFKLNEYEIKSINNMGELFDASRKFKNCLFSEGFLKKIEGNNDLYLLEVLRDNNNLAIVHLEGTKIKEIKGVMNSEVSEFENNAIDSLLKCCFNIIQKK